MDSAAVQDDLATSAVAGLTGSRKSIDRVFSYSAPQMQYPDAMRRFMKSRWRVEIPETTSGAELFSRVIDDPGYQILAKETALLRTDRGVADFLQSTEVLVELGPGDGRKTVIMAQKSPKLVGYYGIERTQNFVDETNQRLREAGLPSGALLGSFTEDGWTGDLLRAINGDNARPTTVVAVGNTLGNFPSAQCAAILQQASGAFVGQGDKLLVGVDCTRDQDVLRMAYGNDITAVFFINSLLYLNQVMRADFDITKFNYITAWNQKTSGVDMFIVSEQDQTVQYDGGRIKLAKGEQILVGTSRKPCRDEILAQATSCGLKTDGVIENKGICLFPFYRGRER